MTRKGTISGAVAGLLSAGLALTLLGGTLASNSASSASGDLGKSSPVAEKGIGVNGVSIDRVQLNGHLMSLEQYGVMEEKSSRTNKPLHLMVDPAAITRGYLVAFDSVAQREAYLNAAHPGRDTAVRAPSAAELAQQSRSLPAAAPVKVGKDRVQLVTCSVPNHSGRLWDGTSCTGSSFAFLWNEYDHELNSYGWNDRASSIAIGDCIANLTVWENADRGGASRSFGGFALYTSIQYGGSQNWSNRISSLQTDKTGPC